MVVGSGTNAFQTEEAQETLDACKEKSRELDAQLKLLSKKIGLLKKQGEDADSVIDERKSIQAGFNSLSARIAELELHVNEYKKDSPSENQTVERLSTSKSITPSKKADQPHRASSVGEVAEPASISLCDEFSEWDDFVDSHEHLSVYYRSDWLKISSEVFRHRLLAFCAKDASGRLVGVLPLFRMTSLLFGDFLVSLPFVNYGGAVGVNKLVEASLMEEAVAYAEENGCKHIEFRDVAPRNEKWKVKTNKALMVLKLAASQEQLWQKFPAKLRSQIRRPMKENTRVSVGGEELIEDFYAVFSENMRDLGTPVYSKSFFSSILKKVGQHSRIVMVYLNDKPVAAGFLMQSGNRMEIPWASSLRKANRSSVNMLMYWECLKFAISQGCTEFDFGRSTKGEGTYKFKKQWGAEPIQCYWHYWTKTDDLPQINPNNPKYKLLIAVWQRLPVWFANLIGPFIVKNIP